MGLVYYYSYSFFKKINIIRGLIMKIMISRTISVAFIIAASTLATACTYNTPQPLPPPHTAKVIIVKPIPPPPHSGKVIIIKPNPHPKTVIVYHPNRY